MEKITYAQYLAFIEEYHNELYKNLRLGQAFLNKFYPGVSNPHLFYQENMFKAVEMIIDQYVDSESSERFFPIGFDPVVEEEYSEVAQRQ